MREEQFVAVTHEWAIDEFVLLDIGPAELGAPPSAA